MPESDAQVPDPAAQHPTMNPFAQEAEGQGAVLVDALNAINTSAAWQLAGPLRGLERRWPRLARRLAAAVKAASWALRLQLRERMALRRMERLIIRSGLFEESWYIRRNADVVIAGYSPLVHWLTIGWREGRDPHPLFNTAWYLEQHPGVARTDQNPLVHYLTEGAASGWDPHPLFSTKFYLSQLPPGERLRENPLVHFLDSGAAQGLDPSPYFSTAWYRGKYAEHLRKDTNPLLHYLQFGREAGLSPHPRFNAEAYVSRYPDVAASGLTPLEHFVRRGEQDGRSASGVRDAPAGVGNVARRTRDSSDTYARVYEQYLEAAERVPAAPEYVPDEGADAGPARGFLRAIAFYLPQFHPIPENDAWWGRGFTEWTNVSKAVPQFEGHYQPHLPGELGFYDLRVPDVQRRQAELARRYGIHGFCYHYYWFGGRRLLERPLEQILADPSIDLPFCICWANENWTRRWDGLDREVLIAQQHSPESDLAFIDDVLPLLRDPRYITVHGRPLLIVYRLNRLPSPQETAARWRERCREVGLPDPYLVMAQTFEELDPRRFGFDAAVEFPPLNFRATDITQEVTMLNTHFDGRVLDYRSVFIRRELEPLPYVCYRTAFPAWDNEPRTPGRGHLYTGASPRLYADWLERLALEAMARPEPEERILFINAWNEWAEGAYLEPDRRYGYAYLQATRTALLRGAGPHAPGQAPDEVVWLSDAPRERKAAVAVVAHVFYPELWDELAEYVGRIPEDVAVFATVTADEHAEAIWANIPARAAGVHVARVPNRGRDMAPFLALLSYLSELGYEVACKLHTKGRSTRADGDEWRRDMLRKLLGAGDRIESILRAFRVDTDLALVAPTGHLLPAEFFWGGNPDAGDNLAPFARLALRTTLPKVTAAFPFPAGSMYWFRPEALRVLVRAGLNADAFEAESGQQNGTLAHALERMVGLACSTDGWQVRVTGDLCTNEPPTQWLGGSGTAIYPYAAATKDGQPWPGKVEGIR